ncbi:MAG: DUF2236 domain-containing protein [Pseudomonadota bacterium]|nr:DUF2236 domain-containing protein [Pseudomonadota bacterium]
MIRSSLFPSERLRRRIAGEVRGIFNDASRGERPVQISQNAMTPPGSVAWRVHGDVTTMMIGGIAGLLLQMLHPGALGGVWDHSDFRRDMLGRLRRTARFIAVTTYGDRSEARAAIARVRAIHARVSGSDAAGKTYAADDPRLLAWVHVAGASMFLDSWIRFAEPNMSEAEQNLYFAEAAEPARALGAEPVPVTRAEADALMRSFIPELRADERSRTVRDLILAPKGPLSRRPIEMLVARCAVDLLPGWARRMHGLRSSGLATPAMTASAMGLAGTLRWALRRD